MCCRRDFFFLEEVNINFLSYSLSGRKEGMLLKGTLKAIIPNNNKYK